MKSMTKMMERMTKLFCGLAALVLLAAACSGREELQKTVEKAKYMCPLKVNKMCTIVNMTCYENEVTVGVKVDEHNPVTYAHEVEPHNMKLFVGDGRALVSELAETEDGKAMLKALVDNDGVIHFRCKGLQTGADYYISVSGYNLKSAVENLK